MQAVPDRFSSRDRLVKCTLPGRAYRGVTEFPVQRVASKALLKKRIAAAGALLSHSDGRYSGVSPLYRGDWDIGGERDEGTLVCYPTGRVQVYSWTLDRARLYLARSSVDPPTRASGGHPVRRG